MSCPYIKKRFTGSGYEKPSISEQSKEMEDRIAKLLAERSGQDTKYFPQAIPVEESKQIVLKNTQHASTTSKTFQS